MRLWPRPDIGNLELHVAHSCNLTCESCSHYSNHNHKGLLSLDDARAWIAPWAERVRPSMLSLLGGEPAIHPDLPAFLPLVRDYWPRTLIRIASNGFLLHRHPDLPARMMAAGKAVLEVSVHHDSPAYRERFAPVLELVAQWKCDHGIAVRFIDSHGRWTGRYNGFGAAMAPFTDGAPRESWANCPAKCRQLFEGGIWKCAPLAYLGMQDAKYGLSDAWSPYLAYRPLAPDSSDAELRAFLKMEDEPACAMCAAKPARFDLPLPFRGSNGPAAT